MNERQRPHSHPASQDPYERGFEHKLYENDIGPVHPHPRPNPPHGKKKKKKKKKGGGGFGLFLVFLAFLLTAAVFSLNLYIEAPMEDVPGRKSGNTTILLAGRDKSGLNTDTLMLVNVDSNAGSVSLMSIPRDTKVNSTYTPHKINGAFAANGGGENGIRWLCNYIRDSLGVYPDGYLLVDLDCFVEIVDLFGGVDYDVPMAMNYEDITQDLFIHLEPGMQHLDGYASMGLVRFRKGYAMQDLDRVKVQRDFLLTAFDQWQKVGNLRKLPQALEILREHSMTNLSTANFLWLAQSALLCGRENMHSYTMPYTVGKTYIYVKADEELLDLINSHFNPYEKRVTLDDLDVAR